MKDNAMKRMYWAIGGCLIFCVLIFHHTFLTFLATWSLQTYSVSKLGKSLQYETVTWIGNQLVIIQPRFEEESFFIAERMALNFHFNFWKRKLHIEVEIEKPHWHFPTPVVWEWEQWAKRLSQEEKWVKIHPHLHVKEGRLTWFSEDVYPHRLDFDLEMNHQEGGYVKLHFNSPASTKNLLILQTLMGVHGVEVNCHCEKIDCPSLIAFTQFLGVDFSPWLMTSGSLHGDLKALFPRMQRPYLEGDLAIENVSFNRLESALKGEIGRARLQLKKNQLAYEFNKQLPTTIGKFEILEPASFSDHSPVQEWSIHQIKGNIQLDPMETARIDLHAQSGNFHHPSQWNLQGQANLHAQHSLNVDAILSCSAYGHPEGKIHLALNQFEEDSKHAKIQCERLSYAECSFLQTLLATYWPVFNEVLLQDGEFNALIEANMLSQGIGELYIKQFEISHLRSKLKPWKMTCDFGVVRGSGKVQLGSEDFWHSLHAGLHLEEGQIEFENLSPPLPLTDIQAHVLIQQGHVEHSLVTLQVAGLKGKMDVEWGEHKQLLTFKLDGIVQDLAELFPPILQEGLRKHFYHNRLIVLANLKRQNQQIGLGGTLHIQRTHTDQMDLIHFGCELKKNQGDPSTYVPVGWFHAHNLPLDKFLSPFIFRHGILQMSGEAEFKGSFDDRFLLIKYDADHLKIENEDLCIEIPRLHSPIPGQLVGSHQLDLHTYTYRGTLPIQSASYFEKSTGLNFQDIQGLVAFKNNFIRILPMEAYCEGIYFAGELELDYSDPAPGIFDVKIQCPTLSGRISQIQHLLAHLDQPPLLNKIPLEGEVAGRKEGLQLQFAFFPQDYHLQAHIQGAITDGALSLGESDMALRGMDMDVNYHHQHQLLEFSDIQGTLLVGKPRRVEEYFLIGHHLRFHQIADPNIDLDIAIKDRGHELLRMVGYTQDELGGSKSFHLNPNFSHISCIYPEVWQCRLKDWSNIEQFEFQSQFDVGKLLQDLQRFRQTGLFFLSHSFIDKISQFLPIAGYASLSLLYHPDQSYAYHLEGTFQQGNSPQHFGILKGSKQDRKWIVDQFQWDDWHIYAELEQMKGKWRIPFLGLKAGQTLLMGLEGDWLPDQALLRSKLKFCEVNLSQLDQFESLQAFITKWWPQGTLNATGEMEWNLLAPNPLEGCKVSLLAEVHNFSLRDYPFKISNVFQIKLHPYHTMCLENIQVELDPQKRQPSIDLQRFEYAFSQEALHSLKAAFQIPHHQLEMLGDTLYHHFPDILNANVKEFLVAAKQQGELKGVLTLENCSPSQRLLRLELEDGLYTFKNRDYHLQHIQLQVVRDELQFSAFSPQEHCPFQITGQAQWPSCQQGQCSLTSLGASNPLIITWENQEGKGWVIRSLQGEFENCSFLLKEDRESQQKGHEIAMQGQFAIDFNRLNSFLTPHVAETIQKLKIGSTYTFVGKFWMDLDLGKTLLETLSFQGKVIGEEAILKGYQVQSLQADMQYVPGRLDIQNLLIQDPAGSLKVASCTTFLDKDQDKWTFFVPRLTVKNLRFSLLRDTKSDTQNNPKFRSLLLKRIECQNLKGDLDHPQTWQAQGNLHFLNPSRKNPLPTLLAIPAEIILRLGLDPHVLNPVTGMIDFNLQGERFYFTRFKDVYSEGRGSKFYLAQSSSPSWMDFEGNLSVNIRMKQYNLIFKIAELFTVSIQGNLKKPHYSLQKQSKKLY